MSESFEPVDRSVQQYDGEKVHCFVTGYESIDLEKTFHFLRVKYTFKRIKEKSSSGCSFPQLNSHTHTVGQLVKSYFCYEREGSCNP